MSEESGRLQKEKRDSRVIYALFYKVQLTKFRYSGLGSKGFNVNERYVIWLT